MTLARIGATAVLGLVLAQAATAGEIHFEGFEDPGWVPGGDNWNNYLGADIERVSSGTDGIASSSGAAHARITNLSAQNDVFGNPHSGTLSPYTRFGGYSNSFGNGFTTSLDVYLDPSWADGQGFDFSVAANRQDGSHLRDFIAHIGVVNGDLLFNASNNSDWSFNGFKLENENGGDNFAVTLAGWYTLEHVFYGDGGLLSVDVNLRDSGGGLLHSLTRTTTDDIAGTVGGNRYGWLVYNNIDGLAIDNTRLATADVPEPPVLAMLLAGGLLGCAWRRRGSAGAARS